MMIIIMIITLAPKVVIINWEETEREVDLLFFLYMRRTW